MQQEVLKQLKQYIQNARTTGNKTYPLSTLEKICAEDITFGEEAIVYFAKIQGNATGEGESYYEGTKTRRTINMDFTTDEYLFVKGHTGAGKRALELYYLKEDQTIEFHEEKEIEDLTYYYGYNVIRQNLQDLNFSTGPYRVNRSKVLVTKGPFKYPIRPILATISNKGEKITLGYIYEMNGNRYIQIEPSKLPDKEKKGCGCGALLFIPFLIAAIAVIIDLIGK